MIRKYIIVVALVVLALVSCGPEDGRAVGGGAGADVGNHAPSTPASKLFVPGSDVSDAQP